MAGRCGKPSWDSQILGDEFGNTETSRFSVLPVLWPKLASCINPFAAIARHPFRECGQRT
jgi:hypothetical protein